MAADRRRSGLILVPAFLALMGCGGRADRRPNLVLIVVDTLRADHLHAYGYSRETSPALDALAKRGVLFEQTISAAPWTLPSVMSLMTGRLPSSHHVENDGMKLSSGVPTLAETLHAGGYDTFGVVSHIYVGRIFGFDRGFDAFEDFGLFKDYRFEAGLEPRADKVTDAALGLLAKGKDRPWFLFVHYFDPHWDYDPPPPFDKKFLTAYQGSLTGKYSSFSEFIRPDRPLERADVQHLIDLYDGEIAYTDHEIARLLEGLRRYRERGVVVAITGDHGEEFKEHRSLGHGRDLYDEAIRVPLILSDSREGGTARRVSAQVRSIDLLPTFCALAELPAPRGIQGESLMPYLQGGEGPSRGAVTETIRLDAYRKSYRTPEGKLIVSLESNGREFYDLRADPGEQQNAWARRADDALKMEQALFEQVEVLAGGWNLRWSSDGSPHRFSGTVSTNGLFTEVIPLFPEAGRHRIVRGGRVDFDLEGVSRSGGLSFTVDPPEAGVIFSLSVDGREEKDKVFVGARRESPTTLPIGLQGSLPADVLSKPAFRPGQEVGYFLWKDSGPSQHDATELTDTMKERLRSLGYVR